MFYWVSVLDLPWGLATNYRFILLLLLVYYCTVEPLNNDVIQVFYAYLMYVEFGAGEWLEKMPFVYSFTHEVSKNYTFL